MVKKFDHLTYAYHQYFERSGKEHKIISDALHRSQYFSVFVFSYSQELFYIVLVKLLLF